MMKRVFIAVVLILVLAFGLINQLGPELAYVPPEDKVLSGPPLSSHMIPAYDLWGESISRQQAETMSRTSEGRKRLSPKNGAVRITPEFLKMGREAFYKETFGNEVFLTDIMGIVDGAITVPAMMKAIIKLRGKGTDNLKVELAKTVTVGGKTFKKGTLVDTGIDVPKGSYLPLGMPVKLSEGKLKVGITCAACHATVQRETGLVVEGAPNLNLNNGLLMAMATNSIAYFTHAELTPDQLKVLRKHLAQAGKTGGLPDVQEMEKQVDKTFLKWPPGFFDSTIDLKSNPTKIPDSFTFGDYPFGWSGFASAGPFHGLSTFTNNVHAQNSDSLSQSEISRPLFGIDKEKYLGVILQNAPSRKYQYTKASGKTPSEFFASVDPTPGTPGVNEVILPPAYPRSTPVAPIGVLVSSPGSRANEQNNAMSAWQNTLSPPLPVKLDRQRVNEGRKVFIRAGCMRCHAGNTFTNHQIVPVEQIGTESSRAAALKTTGNIFASPFLYTPDTPVPLPKKAQTNQVPFDPAAVRLGFAHGTSKGGYKVPSLIGLYWNAPYLHDGGVSVGKNLSSEVGIPETLLKGKPADPRNSLLALVDRDLRKRVINQNRKSAVLRSIHVAGIGHSFWVDSQAGFSPKEQQALVEYLLSLDVPRD